MNRAHFRVFDRGFRLRVRGAIVAATWLCLIAAPASAKPQHLKAMVDYYGPLLPAALQNCSTCHQKSVEGKSPATLEGFPHNAFGARMRRTGEELRAGGRRADIPARLVAIATEDSDGDRARNQVELLLGHRPGDPKDVPTAKELRASAGKHTQLQTYLASYRWRPFEPVRRPAVPEVKLKSWVVNPIDAFVQAKREEQGLKPRPAASREILLRRVYLDLTGLSPTPEERRAFLADRSPYAYEKVVDRLLLSPQYGERWGRHWMDVWRYSDWDGWGEQVRDSQPHIWQWRDWIVDSLNEDKGYDRMVQEMLAADETAPLDANALRATGFLARNFKLLSREKWMEDTVDHTAQAFLGLTVGCARCHDHMYDPITQKEYYRFRAIFEPHHVRIDKQPGSLDTKKIGLPRAYDQKPEAPTFLYVRGDERQPVKDEPLTPGVPESLGGSLAIAPVPIPLHASQPDKQPHVLATLRADAANQILVAQDLVRSCKTPAETSFAQLHLDRAEASRLALEAVLKVEAIEDAGGKGNAEWKLAAADTVTLQRRLALAEARVKLAEAERTVTTATAAAKQKAETALKAASETVAKAEATAAAPVGVDYLPRVTVTYPASSTGRRLALARWLTSAENPLTARVAVNHIWLRHFGEGLSANVADLGRNSQPPTHPELLDWLASAFAAPANPGATPDHRRLAPDPYAFGWSMKRLHRLIVLSNTYRMASTPDAVNLVKDPDNRYLWRMSYRRMDSEIVRDNVFFVAGQLDLARGGPDIDEKQGLKVKRRTLYFRHAPEKQMVFSAVFDGPNVTDCYRRKETVIPQQALALANSELTLVQSRLLARALNTSAGADPRAFVTAAFERILVRAATSDEVTDCVAFLVSQARVLSESVPASTAKSPEDASTPSRDPALRARENLILVLLNHNDFVTIR